MPSHPDRWPALPYAAWADTAATLQLWMQIVGKIRLARTPWLNHSWHVALYVSARGLTTGPMADGARMFEIEFDFLDHLLWVRTSDGHFRQVALRPVSVAEFYADVTIALKELGIAVAIRTMPCEIPDAIPFDEDTVHASYDAGAAQRFFRALLCASRVLGAFPHRLSRQNEPGAFLLGLVRSGGDAVFRPACAAPSRRRAASARRGGARGLFARGVERGLLAGRARAGGIRGVLFLCLSGAAGFAAAKVTPAAAFFSKDLGEFILPYDVVRLASDPDATLMEFLQSTYEAAADLAQWDRTALECALGEAGKPRMI